MKRKKIQWTKPLYNAFLEDAILTELEKKVLYSRVWEKDKWTITKMAMEFHVGRSTINSVISSINNKYDYLSEQFPERYPKRV